VLEPCRSELAREKLTDAAFIQETRVIVDVFREQARSYKVLELAYYAKADPIPARLRVDVVAIARA